MRQHAQHVLVVLCCALTCLLLSGCVYSDTITERIFDNINAGKYDLNDRRSGVKGPGPGQTGRQVRLNDSSKGSGGGCC